MEQDQEEKQHICKLCNKSFSSGKVLGGHMRCHRTQNPPKRRKKNAIVEVPGSYSLRENPKKSWKFSPPNLCKICGKGFHSSKALFGHMRHHSAKRKDSDPPQSAGGGSLVPLRRKRSRRARCKSESSPSSEVEELALCLVMLSRGEGNWGDFEDGSLSKKSGGDNDLDLGSLKKSGIEDCEEGEMGNNNDDHHHRCGVCLKVFGSGQALGGHKRAHLLKPHLIMELQEEEEDDEDEDEEEEEDDDEEFKPWWDGDGDDGEQQQQQQLVVGLVSSN